MKKGVVLFLIAIAVILSWYGESREFFCLDNGRCITVWKTFNNTCYVIPEKYYGIIRPSSYSYIKTTNTNTLDIIWRPGSDSILINSAENDLIINNFPKMATIINYGLNKEHNDSLFTYFEGKYKRYKKEVNYMSIFIKESYAINKNGKKL